MEGVVLLVTLLQTICFSFGASIFSMSDDTSSKSSASVTLKNRMMESFQERDTDFTAWSRMLQGLPQPPGLGTEDYRLLTYQLGEDYNPDYMSIEEPRQLKARDPTVIRRNDLSSNEKIMMTSPQMSNELFIMKLRKVYTKEPKSKRRRTTFGKKTTHRIKNWLWNLSKCPVYYEWFDLGKNVFPRYIKRGTCSKKKTCSYPGGMTCQKKSVTKVKALIYICSKEINSVKMECKWRQIDFYVLAECKCGCTNS